MEKHVVVVYAHPDDESFGAAGTIMKFRKQNVPVTYLCGTLGQMGRNMGPTKFANRETLANIRKQELYDAGKFLDINIQLLGYHDKTIEFEDRQEVAEHIKSILVDIEPSLVITHYPDYAIHPDHNALGAATIEAVRLMDEHKRPTVWAQAIEMNYEEHLGEPDIVHDITDNFDKKLQSILQHKSQAEGMLKKIDGQLQIPEEEKERLLERLGKERFYIWTFENNN